MLECCCKLSKLAETVRMLRTRLSRLKELPFRLVVEMLERNLDLPNEVDLHLRLLILVLIRLLTVLGYQCDHFSTIMFSLVRMLLSIATCISAADYASGTSIRVCQECY